MPVTGATPLGAYELSAKPNELKVVPMLAVYVDPLTGDIERINESRTIVDGYCIEALRVERRSGPAVMAVGQSIREVRHTDPASIAEMPAHVREAFTEFEKQGLINVDKISVGLDGATEDSALISVTVTDYTTNPIEKRPVKVQRSQVT